MRDEDELLDAIKRVEKHLDFAKLVYRSLPFVFWSGFIPLLYILSSLVVGGDKQFALGVGIGLAFALWFILEEESAYRVIERVNIVLGRKAHSSGFYVFLQVISWLVAGIATYILLNILTCLPISVWPLLFFSIGTGLLIVIDKLFKHEFDYEMLVLFLAPLLSLIMVGRISIPVEDYAILVIGSSMGITGFLYIRRAFKT